MAGRDSFEPEKTLFKKCEKLDPSISHINALPSEKSGID